MLQVLDADEEFLVGTRSNVVVTFWGRTTVERIERVTAAFEVIIERFGKTGFGGISVVLPRRANQELPGVDEARNKLHLLVEPHVIAGATVIEGEGMIATATRAAYNAIEKIRPGKHPQKLFGSIDQAASWILPLCMARSGDTLSAKDLAWDIVAARGIRR